MTRSRPSWALAAIPVAVFFAAFGASFAFHSSGRDEPPSAALGASAAGQRIAVSLRAGVSDSYLWTVGLDGSNPVQLTRAEPGVGLNDAFTTWSPDGETILFVRQAIEDPSDPSNPHLYTIDPDGKNLRQLTRGEAVDLLPAWWPDSSRIVFSRVMGEATDLFAMDADGTEVTQLTNNPRVHEDMASVSPDGKRIAYTRVDDGTEDLWVMNADGSGQHALLEGPRHDGSPDFSPDGLWIAFVRDGQIAVVRFGGMEVRILTRGRLAHANPQWSPDGERILFTRDPGEVFVMNADGSGVRQVPLEGQAGGASWGPSE